MAVIEKDLSKYGTGDFFCVMPRQSETQGFNRGNQIENLTINIGFMEEYLVHSFKRQETGRAIIYEDPDGYLYLIGSGTVSPFSTQLALFGSGTSASGGSLIYTPQTATETGIFAVNYTPDRTGKLGTTNYLPLPPDFGNLTINYGDSDSNFFAISDYAQSMTKAYPKCITRYRQSLPLTNDKEGKNVFIYHMSEQLDTAYPILTLTEGRKPYASTPLAVDWTAYNSRFFENMNSVQNLLKSRASNNGYYMPDNTVISSQYNDDGMRGENAGAIFYNILITHDYEQAKKFIDDGTIPDDAEVNDASPSTPDDSNDPGEDGNHGSTFFDGEPTAPSQTAVTLSNLHMYWMTSAQLKEFYRQLWDTDLSDFVTGAFTGIYSNLVSNVVSLKFMPTTPANLGGVGDSSAVILGFKTYDDLTVQTIGENVAPIVDIGSYNFSRAYNSFADYAPYTDVSLFLPFVGIVPLDTNLFMGEGGGKTATLKIKAQYDVLSGLITYYILRGKTPISYISGNMAVEIPVSLQSGLDTYNTISRNFISKSIDFAVNIGEKSPIGMATDIAEGSASAPSQTVFASTGGNGGFYTHPKCAIMIKRPQYNRPSTYAHTVGYPAFVSKKINNLSGYNIIDHPEIPLTDGMTVTERDMIVSQMQSGLHY